MARFYIIEESTGIIKNAVVADTVDDVPASDGHVCLAEPEGVNVGPGCWWNGIEFECPPPVETGVAALDKTQKPKK